MRIWYSEVFIHQPKGLGARKLGECGHQVKFLGYPDNTAGYKVYDPHTHKVSIVCAPIFREEAQLRPNIIFEMTESEDKGDEGEAPPTLDVPPLEPTIPLVSPTDDPPAPLLRTDPASPAPPTATSTPSSTTPSTPPPHHRPAHERHAPCHLDPSDFGAYGHHREAITNAYEDLQNDLPVANIVTSNLEDIAKFILDTAHLADLTVTTDVKLPNNPSLWEALAGPEREQWHQAVLEELAAIKDAGTWELINPSPLIQNIVSSCFVLVKK